MKKNGPFRGKNFADELRALSKEAPRKALEAAELEAAAMIAKVSGRWVVVVQTYRWAFGAARSPTGTAAMSDSPIVL